MKVHFVVESITVKLETKSKENNKEEKGMQIYDPVSSLLSLTVLLEVASLASLFFSIFSFLLLRLDFPR